jgi:hypothetical protein
VNLKHLIAVEKWTAVLGAALLLGAILLLSRQASFSLALGAALMVVNAWLIRRVAARLGNALQSKPSLILVLFNLKLVVLMGLIWIAIRYLHVAPLPFVLGISVLPAAILIVAIKHSLAPTNEETNG